MNVIENFCVYRKRYRKGTCNNDTLTQLRLNFFGIAYVIAMLSFACFSFVCPCRQIIRDVYLISLLNQDNCNNSTLRKLDSKWFSISHGIVIANFASCFLVWMSLQKKSPHDILKEGQSTTLEDVFEDKVEKSGFNVKFQKSICLFATCNYFSKYTR